MLRFKYFIITVGINLIVFVLNIFFLLLFFIVQTIEYGHILITDNRRLMIDDGIKLKYKPILTNKYNEIINFTAEIFR